MKSAEYQAGWAAACDDRAHGRPLQPSGLHSEEWLRGYRAAIASFVR